MGGVLYILALRSGRESFTVGMASMRLVYMSSWSLFRVSSV